jgi:predicted transposase/invertase (TIGR01784 family)
MKNLAQNLEEEGLKKGMQLGMQKGLEQARQERWQEGFQEGRKEVISKIAVGMFNNGFDLAMIEQITGLSKDQIRELIEALT